MDSRSRTADNLIVLCVDLGASGGRVMAARFDGRRLTLDETARFANRPVRRDGSLHWDVPELLKHVKDGIARASAAHGSAVVSVGVAGWGVDYGLLDASGKLLDDPFSYRDTRTFDAPALVLGESDDRAWFQKTGVAPSPINTLFQLAWAAENQAPLVAQAERALLMSDLISFELSGEPTTELTIASTTQMLDGRTHRWLRPELEELELPQHLLDDPVPTGTVTAGRDSPIARETGRPLSVVAVAGHDTASAFAGSGATSGDALLSSGTWALMGVTADSPNTSDMARSAGFTNEISADGRTRILRNLTGFWILQECLREWRELDADVGFSALIAEAGLESPFQGVIDTTDPRFATPGGMTTKISEFCRETGQTVPRGRGAMTRVVLESLALQFRKTHRDLEAIVDREIDGITVVGGGARNALLNQLLASATGCRVAVGPSEATSLGIALVQLAAHGEISDLSEGQRIVASSHRHETHLPGDDEGWGEAAQRLETLTA